MSSPLPESKIDHFTTHLETFLAFLFEKAREEKKNIPPPEIRVVLARSRIPPRHFSFVRRRSFVQSRSLCYRFGVKKKKKKNVQGGDACAALPREESDFLLPLLLTALLSEVQTDIGATL